MSLISLILAYFAAMVMAGNIRAKWLAFASCPIVAVIITMIQGLLAWGFTGQALGKPFYLVQSTILTTVFLVAFTALGYWLVSRRKARNEDRSSSCNTAQSDPR